MITIGYVSETNPFTDKIAWSGTIYKLRESIEAAGFKVIWIKIGTIPHFILKIINRISFIKYKSKIWTPRNFRFKSLFTNWSDSSRCDFLFFPGGAQIMKYNSVRKPYIYLRDANFIQMVNYQWFNMPPKIIKLFDKEEKYAINNACINIVSSDWAYKNSLYYYNGNKDNHFILNFGANIDEDKISINRKNLDSNSLDLLFLGTYWKMKGGDFTLKVVQYLIDKYNIEVHLKIAGIKDLPKEIENLPYVKNYGFLRKDNHNDLKKLIRLFESSHFMILPTKADCSPISFCEASAFGLPILTFNTGGIENYVFDGINGYKFSSDSSPKDMAEKIIQIKINKEYENLKKGCLEVYKEKLNWNIWSQQFKNIINDYIQKYN